MRRGWKALLFLAVSLLAWAAAGAEGPKHTTIKGVLATQPIQNAKLVYWDQAAADALGISVPPGRVGIPAFDEAILNQIAHEIKGPIDPHHPEQRLLYVEEDASRTGRAGRAGYLEVAPGVWVNSKGVGKTKSDEVAGPPSEIFSSHQDGSATLEEGIKEALYSRIADNEMRGGANRVIGLVYTGRTMSYPDGRRVPLVTIIRAPLRRFDQPGGKSSLAIETLAEANSKRILKGDFVNRSNMGSHGEIVDLGCFTHTCGYAPVRSSQDELFLFEGNRIVDDPLLYWRKLGENLLQQMGVPENQVAAIRPKQEKVSRQFRALSREFADIVYWKEEGQRQKSALLDYQEVPRKFLLGNTRLHEFFRDAAANYFASDRNQLSALLEQETQRALELSSRGDEALQLKIRTFLKELYSLLGQVRAQNRVTDSREYAEKIRWVANFKNRDLEDLARPKVMSRVGAMADEFVNHKDPKQILEFIEKTVNANRLGTSAVADAHISMRADANGTEIFLRSHTDEQGITRLFEYPEFRGAAHGEHFYFRLTNDQWHHHEDFKAEVVKTSVGEYLKVKIPHPVLPQSWDPIQISPYIKDQAGDVHWLAHDFHLEGAPLFSNERLGLPTSLVKKPGVQRSRFGQRASILAEDLDSPGTQLIPISKPISEILADIGSPEVTLRNEALEELHHEAAVISAQNDPRRTQAFESYLKSIDPLVRMNVAIALELSGRKTPLTESTLVQIFLQGNHDSEIQKHFADHPPVYDESQRALIPYKKGNDYLGMEVLRRSKLTQSTLHEIQRNTDSNDPELRSKAIVLLLDHPLATPQLERTLIRVWANSHTKVGSDFLDQNKTLSPTMQHELIQILAGDLADHLKDEKTSLSAALYLTKSTSLDPLALHLLEERALSGFNASSMQAAQVLVKRAQASPKVEVHFVDGISKSPNGRDFALTLEVHPVRSLEGKYALVDALKNQEGDAIDLDAIRLHLAKALTFYAELPHSVVERIRAIALDGRKPVAQSAAIQALLHLGKASPENEIQLIHLIKNPETQTGALVILRDFPVHSLEGQLALIEQFETQPSAGEEDLILRMIRQGGEVPTPVLEKLVRAWPKFKDQIYLEKILTERGAEPGFFQMLARNIKPSCTVQQLKNAL